MTSEPPVELDDRGLIAACPQCGKRNRLAYERLGQTFRCGECQTELPLPNTPVEIDSQAHFEAFATRSPVPLLVDFWAPWCGPCKMVAPELAKVAASASGEFLVVKVNTEELPVLSQKFQISAIPTLVIIRAGQPIARKSGALPAAAIRQFVESAVK